jgi:hypothetical protein
LYTGAWQPPMAAAMMVVVEVAAGVVREVFIQRRIVSNRIEEQKELLSLLPSLD